MELVKLLIFLILITVNMLTYGKNLVIGVVKNEPPYTSAFANSNGYYGFCIDLMDEICSRLQESCQYTETTFDKQLEDLRKGRYDMTFFPSPITPTKNEDYLYTLPYLLSTGQFMTLVNSNIYSIKELKDKKIGVLKASFLKNNFLSHYTSLANVYEFTDTTLLLNALSFQRIDAILINNSVAKYLVNNVGNLRLLGKPVPLGMGYGISLLKTNADLANKINKILLQMQTDGTYERIYNKYFGY